MRVRVPLSAPNQYNPNQIFQIGNGFGFFLTFHYDYFENGRRRRASSKRRTRSSAITKKFRQSLIIDSDGIFLMRPLTDFFVPRSPHPQPFKENSFLLSIQIAVCQSQFVGNFHAARRSGDAAQARFAQRNIHLVPDVLLDTCSRSCRENIREDQAVKEALDTPFNKIQKSTILTEMG